MLRRLFSLDSTADSVELRQPETIAELAPRVLTGLGRLGGSLLVAGLNAALQLPSHIAELAKTLARVRNDVSTLLFAELSEPPAGFFITILDHILQGGGEQRLPSGFVLLIAEARQEARASFRPVLNYLLKFPYADVMQGVQVNGMEAWTKFTSRQDREIYRLDPEEVERLRALGYIH